MMNFFRTIAAIEQFQMDGPERLFVTAQIVNAFVGAAKDLNGPFAQKLRSAIPADQLVVMTRQVYSQMRSGPHSE